MHWLYFQVCSDHLEQYVKVGEEIDRIRNSGDKLHIIEEKLSEAYSKRERAVIVSVIFAALCLEAFIYDYGADHRTGNYVKNHIDKLDVPSKLVVLTELVTGKPFPTDSQAYGHLKKLIKDRNYLVHFKSKEFSSSDFKGREQWHEDMQSRLLRMMYNATATVTEVMKEIDSLHENKTSYYMNIIDAKCYV